LSHLRIVPILSSLFINSCASFMYSKNRIEPRMLPWETPTGLIKGEDIVSCNELVSFIADMDTDWVWLERKLKQHIIGFGHGLKSLFLALNLNVWSQYIFVTRFKWPLVCPGYCNIKPSYLRKIHNQNS